MKMNESATNNTVNEHLISILGNTHIKTMEGLVEEATKCFVWFEQPRHLTGNEAVNTPSATDTNKEISLWFNPSHSEYHKWVTVKESGVESTKPDEEPTSGYGLFAARKFSNGDYISIYLGESCAADHISRYVMDYTARDGSGEMKRVDAVVGYPAKFKLYLGAHMANDCNWLVEGEGKRQDLYNSTFIPNLGLVATSDIEDGDEILVDYNYDGEK